MGVGNDGTRVRARRRFLQAAALAVVGGAQFASATARRARVIVAGGGFAGATCALQLRRLDPAIDVTLVDPDESYVTCPLSDAALVGWRSMQSLTVSRAGLARAGVRYVRDRVASIDAQARHIRLASSTDLAYDRLVVAPGIRFLWDRLQGYGEADSQRMPHAWRAGAQTNLLAAQLRDLDDGGVFAICVPPGLMRCPPAPFERASVVAAYLKQHRRRSKVLIFDANNHFPKQDVFAAAWQEFYPGMIEWIPATEGGAVERVDASNMTLYTSRGVQRVAVANVIPQQAPGLLAVDAGLASGHGWCPVKPESFESALIDNVHVIGDACIAGAIPKSASAANAQAKACAAAVVSLLAGKTPEPPRLTGACFNTVAPGYAFSLSGVYAPKDGLFNEVEGGGTSPLDASREVRAQEAETALDWFSTITADTFG